MGAALSLFKPSDAEQQKKLNKYKSKRPYLVSLVVGKFSENISIVLDYSNKEFILITTVLLNFSAFKDYLREKN